MKKWSWKHISWPCHFASIMAWKTISCFFLLLFFFKVHIVPNSTVSHKFLQFISNVSFILYFVFGFGHFCWQIQNYYAIFVYMMGKTEKKGMKMTQLKWPKYQKPKDENTGWTKHIWQNVRNYYVTSDSRKRLPSIVVIYYCAW